ncbi:hypothetical protein N7497_006005 [Penicillium chrysogenum]|nr:hypothetical protein N7497_006005 [Penicillium chrysogenum]
MSSGFVSAGTNEKPIERDDEWLRARQELEEERRRKAEIGKQDEGKSLFEVLERNKMAKQEAFEEKSRLRNQFRSLDEDEVEFLDSVLESTRAKEAAVKRETAEQLEAFHRRREEAQKALLESASDAAPAQGQEWTALARKRRMTEKTTGKDTQNAEDSQKQAGDGGSSTKKLDQGTSKSDKATPATQSNVVTATGKGQVKPKSPPKPTPVSLGLGGYSSDSE